jgi:hypothetical protein
LGPSTILLNFLMNLVLAAIGAELLQLQALGSGLLVLGPGIIAILALGALKSNNLARHFKTPT